VAPYTIPRQLLGFVNSTPTCILKSIIMLFMGNFAYACENKDPVSARSADFFPRANAHYYIYIRQRRLG